MGSDTVITADVYGAGEADTMLGRALARRRRATRCRSSVRSDTTSTPASATAPRASRGSPIRACVTSPRLRGLPADGDRAQPRALRDRSRSTCCCSTTPTGSDTRARPCGTGWPRCASAGLTRMIGVAPGPANGFTLDLIDCLERYGALLDWAMIILNPLEPWPGELVPRRRRPGRRPCDHARCRLRRPVLR